MVVRRAAQPRLWAQNTGSVEELYTLLYPLTQIRGGPGNLNPHSGQINSFLRYWKLKSGPCTC